MPRRLRAAPPSIFQLKVTLENIRPPIWRRLLVPSNTTLDRVHAVLQEAMGWTNSHLHQFTLQDRRIGDPRADQDGGPQLEDERKVRLDHLLREWQRLVYEYDFGDGWTHELLVEKVLEPDERIQYPLCVAGARACPPEDVGGVGGYENFLEALREHEHEQHDQVLTWVGGVFDPEGFDLNTVNRNLRGSR
jgi:hypothetical protein